MAYNNQNGKESNYDKSKDVEIWKKGTKCLKRWVNIGVFAYDGHDAKARIMFRAENTNPNADANKKWINQPGVSGLTQEECLAIGNLLLEAAKQF